MIAGIPEVGTESFGSNLNPEIPEVVENINQFTLINNSKDCDTSNNVIQLESQDSMTESHDPTQFYDQNESHNENKNDSEDKGDESLNSEDNCSEISIEEHSKDLSESKQHLNNDKEKNDLKKENKIVQNDKNNLTNNFKDQAEVLQNSTHHQSFTSNLQNFQVPQSFTLTQSNQRSRLSSDQESPRNDHNYDQKRIKLDNGEISTTLTGPMKLMNCQDENKGLDVLQSHQNNSQRFYRTHSNENFDVKSNQGANVYQRRSFTPNSQSYHNPGQSYCQSMNQNVHNLNHNGQSMIQRSQGFNQNDLNQVHHQVITQSPSHNQVFTHPSQSPLHSNQNLSLGPYQTHPSPYQSHASPYHTQPSPHHYQVMSSPHGNQIQYQNGYQIKSEPYQIKPEGYQGKVEVYQVKNEAYQVKTEPQGQNVYYKPPESYNKFGEIHYQNPKSNESYQSYQKGPEHHLGYQKVQEIRQNLKRSNENLTNLCNNSPKTYESYQNSPNNLNNSQDSQNDPENNQNSPSVIEISPKSLQNHQNSPKTVEIAKTSPVESKITSKSSVPNEPTPKSQESHQNSEDSGEWSSLSPSIESCDDENSFTESQSDFNNFYQPQQQTPQNQPWQYQNYLQNQSHYGYNQPQYSNYSYNYYQEPTTISYVKSPSSLSCEVCVRTFKTASNLTRHLASKTHLKKLASRKKAKPSEVNFESAKKSQISITDISEEERKILWQIDDEIFEFLKSFEKEKIVKKIEIYPTPPLSPSVGKIVNVKN